MRLLGVLFFVITAFFARPFFHTEATIGAGVILSFAILGQMWILLQALGRRQWGVDIIAFLAMLGALLAGEWWAGLIVLVMLETGIWIEAYAFRRAQTELAGLLEHMPRIAHVKVGSELHETLVASLVVGQTLVVKPGEMIPVDGVIVLGSSSIDASRLTGEAMPVDVKKHDPVLAGSFNQEGLLEIRILKSARESQYYRIRDLVAEAQTRKAPLVRLADRWSGWFTLFTLILAGFAWLISGDPVRALAVLIVATPCPLLLATPIAFLSGMSRALKRGIIVKHGGALEGLARIRTIVFDKTGTLTLGEPRILRIVGFHRVKDRDVLRVAASLDQGSSHVLARALTVEAMRHHVSLRFPKQFHEIIGRGVRGEIEGVKYYFGRLSFLKQNKVCIPTHIGEEHDRGQDRGERTVYLARDKWLIGAITFADTLRPGLRDFFQRLRNSSVKNVALLTGDRLGPTQTIAHALGIKQVTAECLPADKLRVIRAWQKRAAPVAMVGDGVNDAPALAQADVGIAMGVHGEGVSSEAADVVLLTEEFSRLEELLEIANRTVRVAKTSIFLGMGLSALLMIGAFMGFIPPFLGAWLQEIVDVTAIVYALQARHLPKA